MKHLLSTTAVVLSLTGAAFAQSSTTDGMSNGMGTATAEASDFMASNLIGMRIYNSEADVDAEMGVAEGAETEWDDIGEINDILLDQNGDVKAVILGVGGFLGLGERDVAISMDEIKVLQSDGDANDRFLVVSTSKEQLEQVPAFERNNESDMEQSAENAADSAANTAEATAAATTAAASDMANDAEETASNMASETEEAASNMANDAEETASEMANDAEETASEMSDSDSTDMADSETANRQMLTQPTVEREGYENASMEDREALTAEDLEGAYVYSAEDETVGEIGSLIMGDNGQVNQVVINVGGFLGLGEKPVAVTWDELQVMKNVEGSDFRIYIDSSEEALEAQPEYQG